MLGSIELCIYIYMYIYIYIYMGMHQDRNSGSLVLLNPKASNSHSFLPKTTWNLEKRLHKEGRPLTSCMSLQKIALCGFPKSWQNYGSTYIVINMRGSFPEN